MTGLRLPAFVYPPLETRAQKAFNLGAVAVDTTSELWWDRRPGTGRRGGTMPKTLLLADDSVTIQKVVGLSFANEDISLLTVDNGDDAIAQARSARPDVVLADVVMPGKNGYEVCEAIKSDPALRHIPVLLLTGTFEAFDEERARRVGADGHITKPFEAQALVDTVNGLLSRAAQAARTAVQAAPPAAEPVRSEAPRAAGPAVHTRPAPAPTFASVVPAPPQEDAYDFFDDDLLAEGELSLADDTPTAGDVLATSGADGTVLLGDRDDAFDLGENETALDFAEAADEIDVAPPRAASARDSALAREAITTPESIQPRAGLARESGPAAEATIALFGEAPEHGWGSLPSGVPAKDDLEDIELEDALGSTGVGAATAALFQDEPMAFGRATGVPATAGMNEDDLELSFEAPGARRPSGAGAAGAGADDPLARLDADDLARETVLDPASGRGHDVSWSDLGDPLAAPDPGQSLRGTDRTDRNEHTPTAPAPSHFGSSGQQTSPAAPRPAPPAQPAASTFAPESSFTTAPVFPPQAPASSGTLGTGRAAAPDLSPMMRQRIHDTLEKVAWEAFSDLSDTIVRQVLERVEAIAWEVIPQMAEALVREEIRRLKGEDE